MAKKSTSWEYRLYYSEYEFNLGATFRIEEGFSKKEAIWEAKRYIKTYYADGIIVKIQTDDREEIEIYKASNRYGQIIFSKMD